MIIKVTSLHSVRSICEHKTISLITVLIYISMLIYAVSLPYNLNAIRLILLSSLQKGFLSRLISVCATTRRLQPPSTHVSTNIFLRAFFINERCIISLLYNVCCSYQIIVIMLNCILISDYVIDDYYST
jgi:hypothetical protein